MMSGSSTPGAGLKDWYDNRAGILRNYIAEIRKAKGQPATPKAAETKKAEPPKPAETKKAEQPKKS